MDGTLVTILKDGKLINIDEDHLCKDDMVVFQAGEVIPADLRLVEAIDLEIDEFDVTGEIMPVTKNVEDRETFLYLGSRVTRGVGRGIVVATGEETEYGNVLRQSWERTRAYEFRLFEVEYVGLVLLVLPAFAMVLIQSSHPILVMGVCLLLATILLLLQNSGLFDHWIVSGEMKNLRHLHIEIRDPLALERMHEIDTICFDKTGVLTTRAMDVTNVYYADTTPAVSSLLAEGTTSELIKVACALCHDVTVYEKIDLANPIDQALISFAQKQGADVRDDLSRYKRVYDKPFDPENRYMACGFETGAETCFYAKGDPAVLLKMCDHYLDSAGVKKAADYEFWMRSKRCVDATNQNGGTAIALAYASGISNQAPRAYTFLCLLHLENSLQPGVQKLVREVRLNGKRSILLTGDRDETAARIGVDCGIANSSNVFLTGKTIERMPLEEVGRQSAYCSIFARLLPSQKGLVIRLLQQRHHRVAMVGDGANDGVALKVADVGISFVQNSSPIARRLSKILIVDIADLLRLIEASDRIKARASEMHALRAMLLVMTFLGIYVWAFASGYIKL
jgi:P-type Ca2+ transporter type 2C